MRSSALAALGIVTIGFSLFFGTQEHPTHSMEVISQRQMYGGVLIGGALVWIGLSGKKKDAPPGTPR